jgi:hypothetical protein
LSKEGGEREGGRGEKTVVGDGGREREERGGSGEREWREGGRKGAGAGESRVCESTYAHTHTFMYIHMHPAVLSHVLAFLPAPRSVSRTHARAHTWPSW